MMISRFPALPTNLPLAGARADARRGAGLWGKEASSGKDLQVVGLRFDMQVALGKGNLDPLLSEFPVDGEAEV